MDVWSVLEGALERHGAAPAVVGPDGPLDYAAFHARARALAGFLQARGLRPGERVSILADNSPRYLAAYFAAAGAGLVLNPLNVRLALPELAAVVADCESRWLLADAAHAPAAQALRGRSRLEGVLWLDGPPEGVPGVPWEAALAEGAGAFAARRRAPDDPAHLYYTSGTTGRSKGVVLTHRNVCAHADAAARELALGPRDVWGHFAPLFHLADAWATFAVTATGGAHACVARFEPRAVLDAVAAARVTLTNLVPTMIVRLLEERRRGGGDARSLRLLLSGGAPIAPAVVDAVVGELGCEYAQTYGMTETSPYLTISLPEPGAAPLPDGERRRARARTGRPFRGVELEVVDERDRPVARDDREVGEVRVRGATVSPGYWNRPEETAAAFRGGWLYTGDLAVVDARGWIDIVDRKKDVIITGGENVYSTEVENALYADPAVLEAAVFGLPDAEWGERVCAAVVLRAGARTAPEELARRCRERLAGYKVPREVHLLDELPRTGSGKIHKPTLRARFAPELPSGPREAPPCPPPQQPS